MNSFIQNAHTVPLTHLVTLNLVLIVALAYWFANYMEYDNRTTMIVIGVLLVASIIGHPMAGIPDNWSYYFGQGERPQNW